MKNTIAQIHHEIDSAQSKLLAEANAVLKNNPKLGAKLAKIGFVNTPIVENFEVYEKIKYYSETYPFLKFLTEEELKRICNKYGLAINPIENYIGSVPEKNADDILNAQPLRSGDRAEDLKYCTLERDDSFFLVSGNGGDWSGIWGSNWYNIPKRIDGEHFSSQYSANDYLREKYGFRNTYLVSGVMNVTENRQGLFMCAPPSQFKGKNKSIIRVEIKDPIVFRYVRGGVQVITKWGLESNDAALILPKDN